MVAIADTSFLTSTINRGDETRAECLKTYQQERGDIYILEAAFAEIAYMMRRETDTRTVIQFFRALPQTKYRVITLEPDDIVRASEILEKYIDAKLDFVDAAIVAVAERLNISRILTLDYWDFSMIRPRHTSHFTILPGME